MEYSPNCEDIFIRLALRDHTDLRPAARIAPPSKKFSLLHIPAQNLLTGTDNGPSGACLACDTGLIVLSPDRIRGRRGDEPERIRMLELTARVLAHRQIVHNPSKFHVQV